MEKIKEKILSWYWDLQDIVWSSNVSLSIVPGARTRRTKPRVRPASTNIKADHFSEIMKVWFALWRLQFPTMIKKHFTPTYK